jgi:hypothetical protein
MEKRPVITDSYLKADTTGRICRPTAGRVSQS